MVQTISARSHSLVAPQFPDGGGPAPGPGDVLNPGPLPPLFTPSPDNVNFNDLKANQYDPASYYSALRGNDTVVLPADQAKADAIGYDPTQIFYGAAGDDFIVGGSLNDLISGDDANDRLFGNSGDDILQRQRPTVRRHGERHPVWRHGDRLHRRRCR